MTRRMRKQVRERARGRCEYCRLAAEFVEDRFCSDHIIAEQHRGPTTLDNLSFACCRCTRHKGPNLAGIDPQTGLLERLFNPRIDDWSIHFKWELAVIVGITSIGRATVEVLKLNDPPRLRVREQLIREGTI